MIYTSDITYNGINILELSLKQGAKLNDVLCRTLQTVSQLDYALKFNCLDYKVLGLDRCDIEKLAHSERICAILKKMIERTVNVEKALTDLSKMLQPTTTTGQPASSLLTDSQQVKLKGKDSKPGFLDEKIVSTQPNTIDVKDDKIMLTGFVPIGAIIMMDASGIIKFDESGKGKIDTDCHCFAICNGQNGTKNRLGRFPRWATTIAKAGTLGGSENFKIALENLPSFDIDTSGLIISESNQNGVGTPSQIQASNNEFGSLVTQDVLIPGVGNTASHSHLLTGKAKFSGANTSIDFLPLFIEELPIQRIK